MKRIIFTLKDSPDFVQELLADFKPDHDGEINASDENALALLIYQRLPNLKESNRKIEKLKVIDEDGNVYETTDFDIYGSLKKVEVKK